MRSLQELTLSGLEDCFACSGTLGQSAAASFPQNSGGGPGQGRLGIVLMGRYSDGSANFGGAVTAAGPTSSPLRPAGR